MKQVRNLRKQDEEYRGLPVFYGVEYQTIEDRKKSEIYGTHITIQEEPEN